MRDVKETREVLETWIQRRDLGTEYEELSRLREKLDQIARQIERLDKELTNLLRQHDQNRGPLALIFSAAVPDARASTGTVGRQRRL